MKKVLTFFLTALLTFAVGWAASVTDVLTRATIGNTETSYSNFSGKTSSSTAVYAGNSAGGNNSIQLRATSPSGIVTTASGGYVKSITLDWNTSSAANRTIQVYGKNSAYSSSADLYSGNDQGTLLGTIIYGTSTTLTIDGDYEYIGLKSSSGSLYLNSITIVWDTEGGGQPTTNKIYKKVTRSDQLVDGKKCIIVYDSGETPAFMGSVGTFGASITGPTISNNEVDITSTPSILELVLVSTNSGWRLRSSNSTSLYLGWTSGNSLTIDSSTADGFYWTIGSDPADSGSGFMITNLKADGTYTRIINYNTTSGQYRFACYRNSNTFPHAHLYVEKDEDIVDPILTVNTNSLQLDDIPYNGSSTSKQFTVTGENLTGDVSISVSGADFSVSPTTISPVDGFVSQQVTVTYSGNSTTEVTGIVTVTSGNLSETVTVTAKKETPPPPSMTVSPSSVTFGVNAGTFAVNAINLSQDLSVSASTGFTASPTSIAANSTFPVNVDVNYQGKALGATGSVTVANTNDNLSETVDVNYVYDGDIYIVGDINGTGWSFTNCVKMTRGDDGNYRAHVTAQSASQGFAWYYFTRQIGSEAIVVANAFGPEGGDQWWMNPEYYGNYLSLDVNGDLNTIYMNPGSYEIVVYPSTNKFSVTPSVAEPVFSPGEGTYYEPQTVTISCETPGAAIYYTTDGSTPTSGSTLYNGPITVNETMTIKAIAISNGMTTNPVSATYTINLPSEDDFYLVTDINDLNAGNEIIFVNRGEEGNGLAMSTTQNNNNRAATDAYVTAALTVTASDEIQVVTLEGDANAGWYFNVGNGYLYAASSSNNYLRTKDAIDDNDNSKASISIASDGVASIVFQGTYSRNTMQFNEGSGIVACYASASQSDVYIYKRGKTQPSITVSSENVNLGTIPVGGTSTSNTFTVSGYELTDDLTITVADDENFEVTPSSISAADANAGNVTVTVTYKGSDASASTTVTVSSDNNEADPVNVTVTGARELLTVTISPADGTTFVGSTMDNGTITSNAASATIYYSTDGGQTWNEYTDGFSVTVGTVGGTATVQAYAVYNGETSATVSATYQREAKGGHLFTRVNNDNQLVAGNKFILVYENDAKALNEIINSGGKGTDVQLNGGVADIDGTNTIVLTMGGTQGSATFTYNVDGTTYYLAQAHNDLDAVTEVSTWAIAGNADSGYYLTNGEYILRYNPNATTSPFRCYSSNTGDTVRLYVQGNTLSAPVIQPASGPDNDNVIEVVTGNETVTVNITTNSDNDESAVTIYTLNGEVPTLDNGIVAENGEAVIVLSETTTVTAISYMEVLDEQGNTTIVWSEPVSETYTFVKKNGVIFDLVKTAPTVGSVYVIVNKDANMGLSTTQNESNRGSVGVMFVDNDKQQVYGNDELAQFVLEEATEGNYYFKNINGNNTGYLVVTTNAQDNLETANQASTEAEASVTIGAQADGYPATVTFNYDGTTRTLRYHATGHVFSTYSDATLNEDIFLYGLEASSLANIEANETAVEPVEGNKQVLVGDELIGVWAVVNDQIGVNQLWAKDQGNASIDKTFKLEDQTDYLKDLWGLETKEDWDQSNWVVLDFNSLPGENPFDYVSRKLMSSTVKGYYTDDVNYTIQLTEAPKKVDENDVEGYPGYNGDYDESNDGVAYYYNHYTPSNFILSNLNAPYGEGAVAGPESSVAGMEIFLMNPKIQEVAQVWAVWMGNDRFDVLAHNGNTINGYDLEGAFDVTWDLNRMGGSDQDPIYGNPIDRDPQALIEGMPYLFHVIISRANNGNTLRGQGAQPGPFGVAPTDLPANPVYTGVKSVKDVKAVESVRYYNVMGMESRQPFEGINIVVTRYTDGTTSTAKVMF